ncbi:MAG: hypothetical protein ABI867_41560 [Kofleriaceae bacterium]
MIRLNLLLLALSACAAEATDVPGGDDDTQPDAGDPPVPPDGTEPPLGCAWTSVKVGTTPWTGLSGLDLAVASSDHDAAIFTALLGDHRELVAAHRTGDTVAVQAYSVPLIANSTDSVSGVFSANAALHIAFTNEEAGSSLQGGLSYSAAPGSSVFLDGAGPLGTVANAKIVLGGDGRVRIAYRVQTGTDKRIAVATGIGSSFSINAALIDGALATLPSIALDAAGKTHVLDRQLDATGRVFHTVETATGWTQPDIVPTIGGLASTASMAVAADGIVHISRTDVGKIIYAHGKGVDWQVETITNAAGIDPAASTQAVVAAVGTDGTIHTLWDDSTRRKLFYTPVGGAKAEIPVTIPATAKLTSFLVKATASGPHVLYTAARTAADPQEMFIATCR